MGDTDTIQVRVDPEAKAQALDVLSDLHIKMSEAIKMFLRQVVLTKSIPFELRVPSERAAKTIARVEAGEGLHEVADADELLKELNS